jgi:signal transduction histidine kinase
MDDRRATNPRKLRNFLLQPGFQIKIGVYNVILAVLFSFLLLLIIQMNFGSMYDIILDLTDVRDEVVETLNQHFNDTMIWVIGICLTFVVVNVMLAIWYTHRFIGPTVAFRRHIDALLAGNFAVRTTLRKDDAFQEIADRLNELSERLAQQKTKTD